MGCGYINFFSGALAIPYKPGAFHVKWCAVLNTNVKHGIEAVEKQVFY